MDFFSRTYRDGLLATTRELNWKQVDLLVRELVDLRERQGRLFVLGLGGSAANASHMANDFRKLANIEAYAPTDNVSELTARINDDGWGAAMTGWLRASRLCASDVVFILSVGGGDREMGVSIELVAAMDYAVEIGAPILGVVGRDGGYAARVARTLVIVPTVDPTLLTPLAEAFQSVIWHGLVCHPDLAASSAHWESLERR